MYTEQCSTPPITTAGRESFSEAKRRRRTDEWNKTEESTSKSFLEFHACFCANKFKYSRRTEAYSYQTHSLGINNTTTAPPLSSRSPSARVSIQSVVIPLDSPPGNVRRTRGNISIQLFKCYKQTVVRRRGEGVGLWYGKKW